MYENGLAALFLTGANDRFLVCANRAGTWL